VERRQIRVKSQVHQILPFLTHGDAIGNLALELRRLLRSWGYLSEIFAENWDPQLAKECRPFGEYNRQSDPDNILILHYSTGGQVNRFVRNLKDRVIIYYHNITPSHYFYWANGTLAQELKEARRDLECLAGTVPAICDSPYNQQELEELGFRVLGIVPPILSFAHLETHSDDASPFPSHSSSTTPHPVNWLHVGRLAPNKCIQDIIKAFYYYHTWITPHSHLWLVGSGEEMQPYVNDLQDLVTKLDLGAAVTFAGHVDQLAPFYRMADVYISMSEHEGFCIPLVEAMYLDVPVVAYASTGIPFTLDRAGVLVRQKSYWVIAEMIHEIIMNDPLRKRLIQIQRARLSAFEPDTVRAHFRTCLELA
jgi:L-malate glycosyltransferase